MIYMGSKNRIAKHILPIMLENRNSAQYWVEPFVGGGNIIDKVSGKRIGSDINKYVIEALIAIRDDIDKLPKNNNEFTEQDYKQLRLNDNYKYKGYADFAFSFGGKWLGGWSRNKKSDDYVNRAYRNALKQSPNLQDVKLKCCPYNKLYIPKNSIIYCDPPYAHTTKYSHVFNHDLFWQWCREKSDQRHTVFISEYKAPKDFKCVWSKPLINNLAKKDDKTKEFVEKLFIYKPRLKKRKAA